MSFLFGGRPQLSSAEKIQQAELEIEMMAESFNKLAESCTRKCIPSDYREADLNKGESVCLDRCVAKFIEAQMKVGEKMQNEMAVKQGMTGGMGISS